MRSFYIARLPLFQFYFQQLRSFSDEELERFVERSIAYHYGLTSPIDWEGMNVDWMKKVARGLGGSRIVSLAEHLCTLIDGNDGDECSFSLECSCTRFS